MNYFRKNFLNTVIALSIPVILILAALFVETGDGEAYDKIVINEVCPSNLSCAYDENGFHPDWVELYNTGDRDIDISDWKLSDSETRRNKWSFPSGTIIPAKGYTVVCLDGTPVKDDGSSGLHASFRLSEGNENLFLSSKNLHPVDSTEIPKLKYDTVWARESDGAGTFIRKTPTPSAPNADGEEVIYPTLDKPSFSVMSGFYDDEFDLTISSGEGEIHYTLDGSVPDRESPVYNGPIHITDRSHEENVYSAKKESSVDLLDYMHTSFALPEENVDKCTVVRAAVYDDSGNISETATASYFVGFDKKHVYDGIGVISLVSDPEGLFGYEDGIYVIGKNGVEHFREKLAASENAVKYLQEHPETPTDGTVSINGIKLNEYSNCNYDQKGSSWEREADLTVFDSDHNLDSSQDLGIRVKGHRTRNFPKKSFNIYARNIYGNGTLDPDLIGLHKSTVSLFTGGNDRITMIKDLLINDMTKGLDFPSVGLGDPYYLFLNGEFWGLYRISEKLGEDYINTLYDVKSDNVIIVKDRVLDGGLPGDDGIYGEFHDFYYNADFSQDSEYEKFKEMADIDNFIDYFAARIYVEKCIDWPNSNLALWRARITDKSNPYADGKWRWINFDNNVNLDYESVSRNTIEIAINGNNNFKRYEPFYNLMRNKDFRKRFYERFAEIVEDTFDPDHAIELLDKYAAEIRPYVEADYKRYYGDNYSLETFDEEIESMRKFFRERAGYILPYVEEACR